MTITQIIGLIVFFIFIAQWAIAFVCLVRLYKNAPRRLKLWQWNIIVLFAIIVGPILYMVLEKPNPRYKKVGEQQSQNLKSIKEESSDDNNDDGGNYNI